MKAARPVRQRALPSGLPEAELLRMHRAMRLTREIEQREIVLYRQNKITGGVYTGSGMEAVSVGSAWPLRKDDPVAASHRGIGVHVVKGLSPKTLLLQLLGRGEGLCHGKDNALHHGDLSCGMLGMISHLGANIPTAVGAALACRMQKTDRVAMAWTGEGATSLGDFHEGLNCAAVWKLPFVLVIENNQWSYSTPTRLTYACKELADRAAAYGIPGKRVDGNDVLAVWAASKEAVDRARAGGGPSLIECWTMRMRGHAEHDQFEYVPREMLEEWKKKDPLDRFEAWLVGQGLATAASLESVAAECRAEVLEASDYAEAAPPPEGPTAADGVYATPGGK
jgi:pyruvate dehydrogenase E1 component alpha subunit